MKRPPTDREILREIYSRYKTVFAGYSQASPNREAKIYVPIEIAEVAKKLNVDGDIVFGRFHYVLEPRYGYKNQDGSLVPFFRLTLGNDRHCVHFPLLASILADMENEHRQFWLPAVVANIIAALSFVGSIVALAISYTRR
jgi:hypothetical protein